MKLSQTNIDTLTDNKKDGQLNSKENTTEELFMSDENNDPDLALDTYEVEKENWETGIRDFFVERLQLEDKEFEVYKSSMKALDTRRAELYNKFLDNYDNATELPFVPSYEEEVALKEIELDIIRGLEKTIGQEKLKSLMEYERQMKVKMLQEKGYYNDYGIF